MEHKQPHINVVDKTTKTVGLLMLLYRRLVSLVGKVPAYRAGGLGSIPGRTNTQNLQITEKVLPLL